MPPAWLPSATEKMHNHIYTWSYLSNCLEPTQGRGSSLLGTSWSKEEDGRRNSADQMFHHFSARNETDGGEASPAQGMHGGGVGWGGGGGPSPRWPGEVAGGPGGTLGKIPAQAYVLEK